MASTNIVINGIIDHDLLAEKLAEAMVKIQRVSDTQIKFDFQQIVDIGPHCFATGDWNVINYKGDNYYRACGQIVKSSTEGTTSCVKRVGHSGKMHEDYDGNIAVISNFNNGPHGRGCGMLRHDHGPSCSRDCPTCNGKV